jgi:hypothetical protein
VGAFHLFDLSLHDVLLMPGPVGSFPSSVLMYA